MTVKTGPSTSTAADVSADIRDRLGQAFRIDPQSIGADDVLRELPGADSVHLLRVVAEAERQWGIELEDEEIFGRLSFDDLVRLVCAHLKAAGDTRG
jgi:acyl carrier protein